eukprot:CAMPEP_0203763034 /NCGR_PEP_ID=MMETSP0098-20131031/15754_1 /ASSEMBLY_ACC=CAM_ASM_000208 /TAXON_ID=96639 /ORGANISM=" , Strain NY0313808BC1" /LENGTH=590 /DNA_ID=CAMNT_0050657637 /DNA_START=262 /DNA_END=2031 /DNA_ORIENTATION=-
MSANGLLWNVVEDTLTARPLVSPALGYCDKLDAMLAFGGFTDGTQPQKQAFVYKFTSKEYTKLTPSDEIKARGAATLALVDSPAGLQDGCRFILFGGRTNALTSHETIAYDLETDNDVWALDLSPSGEVNYTKIEISEPLAGLAGGASVGYKNHMFTYGGVSPGSDGATMVSGAIYRLSLSGNSGTWTKVYNDNETNRFYFGSTLIENGAKWLVYGGRGIRVNSRKEVIRSSLPVFDLANLSTAIATDGPSSTITLNDEGSLIYRMNHVIAVANNAENTMFSYGGQHLKSTISGNQVVPADYVLSTGLNLETQSHSCTTSSGDRTAWCGFGTGNGQSYPGNSAYATGFTRKDLLVVWRTDAEASSSLWKMNMTTALTEAQFVNAESLEGSSDNDLSQLGMRSLQYSLIAACVFLLVSLIIIFRRRHTQRQHSSTNGGSSESAPKKLGLSTQAVDDIPLVYYSFDGNHTPVGPNDRKDGAQADEEGIELQEKQTTHSETAPDMCSICLIDFEKKEVLKQLPCKHLFHEECIEPWLYRRGTCPLCKRHVITGEETEEGTGEGGQQTEDLENQGPPVQEQETTQETAQPTGMW